jgi:CBS domain-containing protein
MTTVSECMSPAPRTIPHDLTVADARQRMFDSDVRHLPVMNQGHLVGLVSERDLAMIESIPGVKAEKLNVENAMAGTPYTVSPTDPLSSVAEYMATNKIGSALVTDEGQVVGIFTTVDAMRELAKRARD